MTARVKDLIFFNRVIKEGEAYEFEKGEKDIEFVVPKESFLPKKRGKKGGDHELA